MNDETEYLADAISKHSTEVQLVHSLLLIDNTRREKLIKEETARQKEPQLGELEILGLSILQKMQKLVLKRTLRVGINNHLIK